MKQFSQACEENQEPILQVLHDWLPKSGVCLEIASGTGQHAACFAKAFPNLQWQPSDIKVEALLSIPQWAEEAGCTNVLPPLRLDVRDSVWDIDPVDAIFNANMVHIAPIECAEGLFKGAADVLKPGAPLLQYGPFFDSPEVRARSNIDFDIRLREQDERWGVREIETLRQIARRHGIRLIDRVAMPRDNFLLRWRVANH